MASGFSYQVEADLIFKYSLTILHFTDRCTKWHAVVIVPNRTIEALIAAFGKEKVPVHGAMKGLVMDQEAEKFKPDKVSSGTKPRKDIL